MTVKQKFQKGFTLLETLVAVMILATAVAGPLSIASRSLNTSLIAKDQITAFFLAQEGVEYVRFVRDSNRLLGADWITGSGGTSAGISIAPCVYDINTNPIGCYVDSTTNSPSGQGDVPTSCGATSCPVMYYNSTSGLYTYNTSATTKTIFTRQIVLTTISSNEYKLTVSVSWSDLGNVVRRVTIYENIYKWQ